MKKWVVNGCAYNEESKEDIEELKRLFYSDRLTQNGKRKLIRYYEKRIKQLEEENKSKQKAYDDCYCEYKHYKQFDSIPTSLIKEKIEELDKRIDFLNTELTKCYIEREKLGTETDIDNNETYIFYMEEEKNFREKQKEILQDILERSREDDNNKNIK